MVVPTLYAVSLFLTLAFALGISAVDRWTTKYRDSFRSAAMWSVRALLLVSIGLFVYAWLQLPSAKGGARIDLQELVAFTALSWPAVAKLLVVVGQVAVGAAILFLIFDATGAVFNRERAEDFQVRSFKDIGSEHDQEKGVVRLSGHHWGKHAFARRNELIRITHRNGGRERSIYRLVRFNSKDGFDKDHIAMEYDDSRELGIADVKGPVRLILRRASPAAYVFYLWDHTDLPVRWQFRMSVVFSVVFFLIGIFLGAA